ncbi:MAG TPA: O-antigen ligase family protein [Bryobacteraceae bacterium]|nr:O-antigen ligase family protein [Bryobacteraceae bacterium]
MGTGEALYSIEYRYPMMSGSQIAAIHPDRLFPYAVLGAWSAAVAVAPPNVRFALTLPVCAVALVWWMLQGPSRWIGVFFAVLILTPPLALPAGEGGFHLVPVFLLPGILAALVWLPRWERRLTPLVAAALMFLATLAISAGFAAIYSGFAIALGSLLRVALFGISLFVLIWATLGPRPGSNPLPFVKFLLLTGTVAALFACVDYYFQFPPPAGFAAQYVWLDEGVFRRAQGLFYDASTSGNFCAFFLTLIAVSLFRPRRQRPASILALTVAAIVFSAALILSYSRASLINVLAGLVTLTILRKVRIGKALLLTGAGTLPAIAAVRFAAPSFWANYQAHLTASIQYFASSPNGVLSGRLTHWETIVNFLIREPWRALFGVGFKTLASSNITGEPIIADNTWLSLLAETGLAGLGTFLVLNFAILRSGLRAARSANHRAGLLGEWIFCFWVGELAQMFSGDLITYWRVLPLYFWVLGTAARESESG